MNLTPVVARLTSLPANLWRTAAPLALALAWTTPALAGFGGSGGEGGECPPECMCTGLDCPEVHVDCSGCAFGGGEGEGGGVGGGDDECIQKDGRPCNYGYSTVIEEFATGLDPLWCETHYPTPEDQLCALGYYYMLAACTGEVPLPGGIGEFKEGVDFGVLIEEILDLIKQFNKVPTFDDLWTLPSIQVLWESLKCNECVWAADAWAGEFCPVVLGTSPVWGNNTSEVCIEATTNGGLFEWHEERIGNLITCQLM